jgi:hypothetical protein
LRVVHVRAIVNDAYLDRWRRWSCVTSASSCNSFERIRSTARVGHGDLGARAIDSTLRSNSFHTN